METKHTKGEWINGFHRKGLIQVLPDSPLKTTTIANVYGNDKEMEANAKLIAAAPDLLDVSYIALALCIKRQIPTEKELSELAEQLQNAIKKATL